MGHCYGTSVPWLHSHNHVTCNQEVKKNNNANHARATASIWDCLIALQWRHNGHDGLSNHQPSHCLLNRLLRHRSKNTSKLRVTGLCSGNSPGTGEFPAQMASNAENVPIWWRHHGLKQSNFYGVNNSSSHVGLKPTTTGLSQCEKSV